MQTEEGILDPTGDPIVGDEETENSFVDKKILRMMEMMGYQSGLGLGKNQQGVTQHVTIQGQFQRRGLGLKVPNLQYTNESWDFSLENVSVLETLEWLVRDEEFDLNVDNSWIKEDKIITNIEHEYNFCDKEILHNVIEAKNIFDVFDLKELCYARARANPFETIKSVFFMNRAALKMANIDASTDFMFTSFDGLGPYYFADVCAGPGGFTEYILWRKGWQMKGFGFTLKGENDFKLTESVCASPVTFLPLYGAKNDGDVCCPENIDDFKEKVLFETGDKGVHFMMSDGGFSVEGNENLQEVLSKNIYICQCLIALEILRTHGHFVTKLFDIFTCFSMGLLYLIYYCFEKICILKPNSSRPANSERYLICYNYTGRDKTKNIRTYLRKIVDRLWELKHDQKLDIIEIVPLDILKKDNPFYSYFYNSNNRIAKSQTINLKKLAAFCRNPLLLDHRQDELRKNCLQYWQIPDKPKISMSKFTIEDLLLETVYNTELLLVQPREIQSISDYKDVIKNLDDWHFTLLQCGGNTANCNFYAGLYTDQIEEIPVIFITAVGLYRVYKLQGTKWARVKNLQLVHGTFLYGELVKEKCTVEGSKDTFFKYSLHVIDALRLGNMTLSDVSFKKRCILIQSYCKAVNHEFRANTIRIRPKIVEELGSLSDFVEGDSQRLVSVLPVVGYKSEKEFYDVNSLLLLKTDEDQSFHSTYVLRLRLCFNKVKEKEESLEELISFVKNKTIK